MPAPRPQIIGWAHTPFGRLVQPDVTSLMAEVIPAALNHAGLTVDQIDAVFTGVYNNGFSRQDFTASLPALTEPGLRFTPATHVENACATGSAAVYAACDFIEAGRGDIALVIGAEKMTGVSTVEAGEILLTACYAEEEASVTGGFAGVFAAIAQAYAARYGDPREAMALIAAKNHRNGAENPLAQLRRDLGFDFCNEVSERNPSVAAPLRRTDCSPISDGAAALVIARSDLPDARRRVGFRARRQVNDFLPLSRRDPTAFDGARRAWTAALAEAGMQTLDLDVIETHDCFTIAELIEYEVFGLAEPGRGVDVIASGLTEIGGKLPVNPSGGLKSKGHPIGATGVSMHVLAAMQLCGEAPGPQVPGAETAAIFNMGGTAVANYVSILEQQ